LLRNLARRLEQQAPGVAASLLEGLDEMLTVARLKLPTPLRRLLACTNVIENIMGTVRRVWRNVKRWRNAAMALRWTAAGMLEAPKGFRRWRAHKHLPVLRAALAAHRCKYVTQRVEQVVEAYRYVMQLRHKPAVLVLSRQPLPTLDRGKYAPASGLARGAYVLADPPGGKPEVILISSGSEVSLCVNAHEELLAQGIRSRVVSMPSWDIFEHQTQAYQDSVLPPDVTARVAVEQASTFGWERYVGRSGRVLGMNTSCASS